MEHTGLPHDHGEEQNHTAAMQELLRDGAHFQNIADIFRQLGGRLRLLDSMTAEQRFQSTPPARGTTLRKTQWKPSTFISIHAPREGDD